MSVRLCGLLDASLAVSIRGGFIFDLAPFQFHPKETCIWKKGIHKGGTNDLSSVTFYRTRLPCHYFASRILTGRSICLANENCFFSFGRKDDRGLRFWLGKPTIDWMQHIDLKERIIIWVAFDFPDLPCPDFGLLNILRNGRTGFRRSGAPPVGAGRPGAPSRLSDRSLRPQLCAACRSLPAGKILPLAHTNGSTLRSVKHRLCGGLSQENEAAETMFLFLYK